MAHDSAVTLTRPRSPAAAAGGGLPAGAEALTVRTDDGERLLALLVPGGPAAPAGRGVVVAHGFSGSWRRPAVLSVVRGLTPYATVLALDLRGHGGSSGLCTFGDREVLDVDAAVRLLRDRGLGQVVTCGWSMGGTAVVRHAALRPTAGGVPDAVVAVSTVSRWFVRDTAPMRRLHWLAETRTGRLVTRVGLRTRLASTWGDPEPPVAVVGRVAPVPLLLVHGDRDPYFPLEHPRALLAAAAPGAAELWEVAGMGHAETAATPELLDRIGAHLSVLLGAGREVAPW